MSLSDEERRKARDAYGWESVEKDIALSTPLTIYDAGMFGRAYMHHTGIHPYDLVSWVCSYYRHPGSPSSAIQCLILGAFQAGREVGAKSTPAA